MQATLFAEPSASPKAIWTDHIPGRYRNISVHQLCMAVWLFQSKQITKRQLRIYFACHAMAERRRYTRTSKTGDRRPHYNLLELRRFIGGSHSAKSQSSLKSDLLHLGRIGLVCFSEQSIGFATSYDQLTPEAAPSSDLGGFWAFYEQIPNKRRTVPVPRRTLRALAGGLPTSVTLMVIALLIRSLFWHSAQQGYRLDGRTKCSWISEVFGLSRRAVTDARKHLITLGWIQPLACQQWELNKWGQRYQINPSNKLRPKQINEGYINEVHKDHLNEVPQDQQNEIKSNNSSLQKPRIRSHHANCDQPTQNLAFDHTMQPVAGQLKGSGFASPLGDFAGESASPDLNKSTFPKGKDLITNKLQAHAANGGFALDTGVSPSERGEGEVATSSRISKHKVKLSAQLHDLQPDDLKSNQRLLSLYPQAIAKGWIEDTHCDKLNFFAFAERALAHGQNPMRLFIWLVKNRRYEFITQSDEDAAHERLRLLRDGKRQSWQPQFDDVEDEVCDLQEDSPIGPQGDGHKATATRQRPQGVTDTAGEDAFVIACLKVANQHNTDPFQIARQAKGWTLSQWQAKYQAMEKRRVLSWQATSQEVN